MNEHTPVREDNGSSVPLKEYIERVLDERDKAVTVAYRNLEMRLDLLNNLRSEVQEDRSLYMTRERFDVAHEALGREVGARLNALTAELSALKIRVYSIMGVIAILATVLEVVRQGIFK